MDLVALCRRGRIRQTRRVVYRTVLTCAWLALTWVGAGCEIHTGPYTRNVGDLPRADRIDVSIDGSTPIGTITDRRRIADVAAFMGRYRDGWINALSAVFPEFYLFFYDGERLLARIGVGSLAVFDDGFARPLSSSEITELVDLLGIPWPSQKSPQGPPSVGKAP